MKILKAFQLNHAAPGRIAGAPSAAVFMAAALFLACPLTVHADDPSRLISGTTINGISVSDQTVTGAAELLQEAFGHWSLVLKGRNGVAWEITGSDIGFRAVVDPADVQAVLDAQNAADRVVGPGGGADRTAQVPVRTTYDSAALENAINSSVFLNMPDAVPSSDAHLAMNGSGPMMGMTIVPEVRGTAVDPEKYRAAVRAAADAGLRELDLDQAGCYGGPNILSTDPSLQTAMNAVHSVQNAEVTWKVGDLTVILNAGTFSPWISGTDADGTVAVNRDALAGWLKSWASSYSTMGTARTFHCHDGRDVTMSKGTLGWAPDIEAEADAAIAVIKSGGTAQRTLAPPAGNDWGNTYIEVDLAGQHVWYYKDGQVVWDAPCVSGKMTDDRMTPEGFYYIYYKETNRDLKGKIVNGKPEYIAHVDYWMPFYRGYGMHDASWRSDFGGKIYVNSGSHGCVNLPPSKVKALYESAPTGTPVVCHY